ncbi:MAG: CidA/LrgA family protein, partial [Spirochaetae bacterium HGW-Spirochaetae-4]
MKIMEQLTLVTLVGLAGIVLASLLPIPFPGSIMSMLLMFILLLSKAIRIRQIEQVSQFFLANMGAFFIVPVVAILEQLEVMKGKTLQFFAVCIVSALITFIATAGSVKLTLVLMKKSQA